MPASPEGDAEVAGAVRAAFHLAFERMGGAQRLADWAHAHPAPFYALLSRLFSGGAAGSAVLAQISDVPLGAEPLSEEAWALLCDGAAR